MRLIFLILLLLPFAGQAQDRYTVSFDDGLDTILVTACFDGSAPGRIYHGREAGAFTNGIHFGNRTFRVREGSRSVRLNRVPSGACLKWQVDIAKAADSGDQRLAARVGSDLVMNSDLWFWKGPMERELLVRFELPEAHNVSVPWAETGTPDEYRPDRTPSSWASRIAIGKFPVETIPMGERKLRIAALGALDESQRRNFRQWIGQAAESVSTVCGFFPQDNLQVLLVPIGERRQPVPWAHVIRGGGIAVEFFVDETSELSELAGDWTAPHELSHALLPFVSRRDRWLSEGLASYYQWVLLARSGNFSERDAWQGMADGFRRGRRGTRGGTLAEVTQQGREHTMRVYWSGAAMMLMADAQLRAETDGRQSLDTALMALQDCCMANGRSWRASEVMEALDRLTGTRIFMSLYRQHVNSLKFPDVSPAFRSLGIDTRRGSIRLSDSAEQADIRTSIMADKGPRKGQLNDF